MLVANMCCWHFAVEPAICTANAKGAEWCACQQVANAHVAGRAFQCTTFWHYVDVWHQLVWHASVRMDVEQYILQLFTQICGR